MEHTGGKGPNGAFMAHCHREMYHAQWSIILDDEFLEAYEHGIVIECCDDIRRRFYPRIFTHSADYKEKQVWIFCTLDLPLTKHLPGFLLLAFGI